MTVEMKLAALSKIAEKLNAAGAAWAVGASLLLYLKGIAEGFNDIDIMIDPKDVEAVDAILSSLGARQPLNPNARYRTGFFGEYVVDGVDVDVMADFVIVKDGARYDCPFDASRVAERVLVNGQDVPLQAVSDWRRYYELMGREAKTAMIDAAGIL